MKEVVSIISALVIAIIFVTLVLFAFKLSFAFVSFFRTLVILGLTFVFALPLYIIIRKKFFK